MKMIKINLKKYIHTYKEREGFKMIVYIKVVWKMSLLQSQLKTTINVVCENSKNIITFIRH